MAANAVIKFLNAAKSLANQGMSKDAIMQFAKNEFGQINELFQKQIDNIFKPGKGIENIKIKDEVFDDTVIKLPIDNTGTPFNPNNPLKDYSKKPRDKKYTGGMVEVEPSLSDIGHGSDALMARTRLVAPNSQATTSTGLNYLLAEDNDNIRVPFENGGDMQSKIDEMIGHYQRYLKMPGKQKRKIPLKKFAEMFATENFAEGGRIGFANGNGVADEDAEKAALGKRVNQLMDEGFDFGEAVKQAMSEGYAEGGRIGFSKGKLAKKVLDKGRRGFMKAAGAAGAGIAALKTGLLGFGKEAAPVVEKVAETVSETAKGVPPYFFKLVDKIKTMGDDVTEKMATQERQKVTRYKDFELTEDVATGEQTIQRIKIDDGNPQYYDETLAEETYMNYKPGKGQSDEAGRVADEYTEDTSYIRTSGPQKGEIFDTVDGVPDDVIEEGTMFEDNITDFGKASGGIARMIGE